MSSFSIAKWLYEQRYLHSKIREFGAGILAPNFKTGHKFQTDFFGLKWAGTTNNHVDFQVLLRGAYEKFMLFFIRDIIIASKGNNDMRKSRNAIDLKNEVVDYSLNNGGGGATIEVNEEDHLLPANVTIDGKEEK